MVFWRNTSINRFKQEEDKHILPLMVPFFSQRVEKGQFFRAGYESWPEAQYWQENACGIACLQMVLGASLGIERVPRAKELIDQGIKMGAYDLNKGWIHQGLAQLAAKFGLKAQAKRSVSAIQVAQELKKNHLVIASVTVGFLGGQPQTTDAGKPQPRLKGGHLAVVHGYKQKTESEFRFLVHHPSSVVEYEWSDYWVDPLAWKNSFSGNIILVWLKDDGQKH